jgi:glycine/D-amino acid oxidase-like deaminating enzyme
LQQINKTAAVVAADITPVRKTASFFEFYPCLSRACLGKMIVLYINGSKCRFSQDMVPVIDGEAVEGLVVSTGYSGHGLGKNKNNTAALFGPLFAF